MVCVVAFQHQFRAVLKQKGVEAGRIGNGGKRRDFASLQIGKRETHSALEHVFQIFGTVTALDDFRAVIVFVQKRFQMPQPRRTVGLRQKDVVRPLDVADRLPEESPRQHVVIVKRRSGIHQQNIDVGFQTQVLESVIQNQRIGVEFLNGIESGFHPVLIHEDSHLFQIGGQHVRFVTGSHGVEQQVFAVGNHTRGDFHFFGGKLLFQLIQERPVPAAVTAAENCHAASFLAESLGEDFHDGRLARTAAGQVADTDYEASDCPVPDYPVVIEPEPEQHESAVDARREEEQCIGDLVDGAVPLFLHYLNKVLFNMFTDFPDSHTSYLHSMLSWGNLLCETPISKGTTHFFCRYLAIFHLSLHFYLQKRLLCAIIMGYNLWRITMDVYEAVIGLEAHVQIRTKSKMFCTCPNQFGAEPNTLTCPVCMGMPGTLPVLNHEAVRKAVTAGLMCGCEIARRSKFDRKNYFYPDLVKNYQITQYDQPICKNGRIHIQGKGFSGEMMADKYIGMTRIHLEEDPGKSTHFGNCSGLDYNRSGVPLLEIVSEPDMRTPDEAYAYLTALKQIMQYADVSDCDMEKGQMRCDVNVSIRKRGATEFGTKVEVKNLNSFRAAHRAVAYEIKRQILVLESGGTIEQDTRGWNDDAGESYVMRSKENAHDYRYFPEPDLLPVVFTEEDIEEFQRNLPEHPEARRIRYVQEYGLTEYDAHVLTLDRDYAAYFEKAAANSQAPKLIANWFITDLLRLLPESGKPITECPVTPENLAELVELVRASTITGKTAKTVFEEMFSTGRKAGDIVKEKGLVQVSDEGAIMGFVDQVISGNPAQVEQYRGGKTAVLQYLVGQVMKMSRGKANPQLAMKLLKDRLD